MERVQQRTPFDVNSGSLTNLHFQENLKLNFILACITFSHLCVNYLFSIGHQVRNASECLVSVRRGSYMECSGVLSIIQFTYRKGLGT